MRQQNATIIVKNHYWQQLSLATIIIANQCVTRSLFQFSRREREFLSFNLMFETRTRISFSQSRASRREREFLFSISGFETRTRIEIETILARIFGNYIYCLFNDRYFQKKSCFFSKFLKIICPFFSRNLNKNLIFLV